MKKFITIIKAMQAEDKAVTAVLILMLLSISFKVISQRVAYGMAILVCVMVYVTGVFYLRKYMEEEGSAASRKIIGIIMGMLGMFAGMYNLADFIDSLLK